MIAVPTDKSLAKKYEFYMHVAADGGATFISGKYTLIVGCVAPIVIAHPPSGFYALITGLVITPGS